MSKFMSLLVIAGFLGSVSAFAAHNARPVESLHDLPMKWEGVAGDLLHKTTAVFTIDKVTKVTRDDKVTGVTKYDVEAALVLGERKLNITKVTLLRYSPEVTTGYEVNLETDDNLTQNVFAQI